MLFVLDATAPALWEEPQRARDLARLLAVLKRSQPGPYGAPNGSVRPRYTVILGVTKLLKAEDVVNLLPRRCLRAVTCVAVA